MKKLHPPPNREPTVLTVGIVDNSGGLTLHPAAVRVLCRCDNLVLVCDDVIQSIPRIKKVADR